MKTLGILLGIMILLGNVAFAEDELCFNNEETAKMVVVLESVQKMQQLIDLQKEALELQERRLEAYEQMEKIRERQLAVMEDANKRLVNLINIQQESYEKALKASQPSVWDGLKTMSFGAVLALIAVAIF